jgi:hypothetical protein
VRYTAVQARMKLQALLDASEGGGEEGGGEGGGLASDDSNDEGKPKAMGIVKFNI